MNFDFHGPIIVSHQSAFFITIIITISTIMVIYTRLIIILFFVVTIELVYIRLNFSLFL